MFTKSKNSETPQPDTPPAQAAVRSGATKPATRSAPSIISSDMVIKGSVNSRGEMQIDGTIEGDVAASSLTIGQSGSIKGEVMAETVTVRGKIVGSIRSRKVELETGSRVEGDIVHASLSIQSNAVFEGQVKHADDPLKQSSPAESASGAATSDSASSAKSASSSNGSASSSSGLKSGFGPTT
ncbi:MAG: polymer-forming cytoskeletal protein [Pseudomonadota bacterium]